MHMMAEENGDATWLKSTFKLMISQLRRCWKLAEVVGARGLMRRPAEVAGVGGRPAGELDFSSAPGGPACSTGGTASSAQGGGRPVGERDQLRRELWRELQPETSYGDGSVPSRP
jgi:hypothetical protein